MPSSNREQYHGVGSDMIGYLALGFTNGPPNAFVNLSAGVVHPNLRGKTRSNLSLVPLGPNFEGQHGRWMQNVPIT